MSGAPLDRHVLNPPFPPRRIPVLMLFDPGGDPDHPFRPLARCNARPYGVGLTCGEHCGIDLFAAGAGKVDEFFPGRRVEGDFARLFALERAAADELSEILQHRSFPWKGGSALSSPAPAETPAQARS